MVKNNLQSITPFWLTSATKAHNHHKTWCAPGHVPDCLDPEFEEYFALGPLTRYAEDLTLLLKVLRQDTGPDVPLDAPVS